MIAGLLKAGLLKEPSLDVVSFSANLPLYLDRRSELGMSARTTERQTEQLLLALCASPVVR